jgi:myo-inositol-1(or 4)-monophosphatase
MRHFHSLTESWEKSPGQTVTEADLEIDRFLRETLPGAGEGWLSEETEDDRKRLSTERVWIVDPIDGTRAYAYGKPEFAISIALVDDQGPLAGWLFNPASDELLETYRDAGCWMSGQTVGVTGETRIENAEILVSSGERRTTDLAQLLAPATVRPLGSLAYKLMQVACGKADAYVSFRTINDWDLAAGILAVREAGGMVTNRKGRPHLLNQHDIRHDGIVASGPNLHAELLKRSRKI